MVTNTNTPLRDGFIRLFGLSAGGELEIQLQDYEIARCPNYVALSYVWGSNENKCVIRCNGTALQITRNLYEGLLAVRRFLGANVCLIWADAICINQGNAQEKTKQVLQMDRIFSAAGSVVVSLGPNAHDSEAVFEYLAVAVEALRKWGSQTEDSRRGTKSKVQEHLRSQGAPDLSHPFWRGLHQIPKREWFSRVWTYQEAALAQTLWLCCGYRFIEWTDLEFAMNSGPGRTALASVQLEDPSHRAPLLSIEIIRRAVNDGNQWQMSYSDLIARLRGRRATDPRDYVYGALSLADTALKNAITVDYADTSEQGLCKLFLNACRSSLQQGTGNRLLEMAAKQLRRSPNLPSWCPDPRQAQLPTAGGLDSGAISVRDENNESLLSLDHDGYTLQAKGYILDVVRSIAPATLHGNQALGSMVPDEATENLNCIDEWLALVRTVRPNLSPGEIPSEFLHAIFDILPELEGELTPTWVASFQMMIDIIRHRSRQEMTLAERHKSFGISEYIWSLWWSKLRDLHFFITKDGYMGWGHPSITIRDVVFAVQGAKRPFILRKSQHQDQRHYLFIGDAWVVGLMNLEALLEDRPQLRDEVLLVG